jgi:hypothetical protein
MPWAVSFGCAVERGLRLMGGASVFRDKEARGLKMQYCHMTYFLKLHFLWTYLIEGKLGIIRIAKCLGFHFEEARNRDGAC